MKTLYSSTDLMEMAVYKHRLAKAGIPCEILNDAMTPAMLELARYPELCVQNDADLLTASLLLSAWQRERPTLSHQCPAKAAQLDVLTL